MNLGILLVAIVVIVCVLLNKISNKMGIPMLLAFIVLGMLFGSDGIFRIPFDNYLISEQICSVALIFIMFYGGFGTNWEQARPVAPASALLSTAGVVITAGLTGLFCHFVLRIELAESFLIGAVIGSTDAASVFSILRSKQLGLKHGTDSMLELESGSNDPTAYMLTIILLSIMDGSAVSPGAIVIMVLSQLAFGLLVGVAIALLSCAILRRFHFATAGFDMAFVIGIALLSYALASILGGNGYLSAYLCGIIIGNVKIPNKKPLVHFFDGLTGLMQMLIFFLLGLLATPSMIPPILLTAVSIMLFLTFVARPAAVCSILTPFRAKFRQQLLVAFAGLRGAASIVFAILSIVRQPTLHNDLFHIVFCVVLLSIGFQGSFLPLVAKRLGISDQSINVMKTFSDYSDDAGLQLIKVKIHPKHPWSGCAIREITLPPDTLIVMILRDSVHLIPDGKTVLRPDDIAILSAHQYNETPVVSLREQEIHPGSKWEGRKISDFSPHSGELVIMILRGEKTIIPTGDTVLQAGDILVINSTVDTYEPLLHS